MPVIKVKSKEVKIKVPLTTLRIEPTTQSKTVKPSIEEQTITPDEGIFALSSVTVNPVTSEIDKNIKAENIKEGVSILGVEGTIIEATSDMVNLNNVFNKVIAKGTMTASGYKNMIKKFPDYFFQLEDNSAEYLFADYIYDESTLPEIDYSEVTKASKMFYNTNITKLPKIHMPKVTTLLMFCFNSKRLTDVSGLQDISNVERFSQTFENCESIEEYPEHFDFSHATYLYYTFARNISLRKCPNGIENAKNTNWNGTLQDCALLTDIPCLEGGYATSNYYTISGCTALVNFGGFRDLGKSYKTSTSQNYSWNDVRLDTCPNITEQSIINTLNLLYDIGSIGVKSQQVILGDNITKLTSEEGQQALANATAKGWTVK